ncbi:MAG: ABC transporter permease [Oscillospiraceae bacterium]|nr:ABC transporter permease [Oscillospiraceae bacterium]
MDIGNLISALPGAAAQGLIWGIMAIGVYLTYRILDVADLTVDGTMATGGAVCVMLTLAGLPMPVALLASVAVGMLAGLVTGIFHTIMGIPAILAGILTQLGLWSINLRILGMANKAISVDKYNLLVSLRYIPRTLITVFIVILLVIGLLYWFFGTERGCSIRATGANQAMARAQGINTRFNIVLGLMISNGIVALASALYSQYQGFADVNSGRGAIVIGLAAVIIGEVLFGKLARNFAVKLFTVAMGGVVYYLVIQFILWLGLNANDLKLISALVVAVFLAVPYWRAQHIHAKSRKRKEAV